MARVPCAQRVEPSRRRAVNQRPKILLIDNYDSFTYNLVQAFLVLGAEVSVHRNDLISVRRRLQAGRPPICDSPGPGTPRQCEYRCA